MFFALIIRKVEDDQPHVEEQGKKLAQDEEWLHAHADTSFGTPVDTMTLRPPDDLKLSAMRELRYKERKMGAISREILLYSFYVFITLTISYSLREEQGYWQTLDIEEMFNLKVRSEAKFPKYYYQFDKVGRNLNVLTVILSGFSRALSCGVVQVLFRHSRNCPDKKK